jgi:anti-sigma regulatory factor (Ser/Thr protein kinase)
MPYLRCPNCGTTAVRPVGDFTPGICAECCARLRADDVSPVGTSTVGRQVLVSRLLPGNGRAPMVAREALAEVSDWLDRDVAEATRLLASELVTNSVRHTNGGARNGIRIDVSVLMQRLRVSVYDDGHGFEPAPRAEGQDIESGWGLHLVNALASDWGVDNGDGTRVWFELEI